MALTLRVPDPELRFARVGLRSDVHLESGEFAQRDGEWVLELPPLALDRVEYELEITRADGTTEQIPDPANPRRAPGAFGEKSVIQADGYEPPWWLAAEAIEADWLDVFVGRVMRRSLTARVWVPAAADPDEPLGLLVAHDGPEYESLARLSAWAGAVIATGGLPPFRLALLGPGDRDQWYSASEGYARALAERIVPRLTARLPARGPVVGMGASLGALSWLHAHRRFPALVGALFLQSGSFFMPEFDAHEAGFSGYARILPFVNGVRRTRRLGRPIRVGLTCGTEEENIHNNRAMAEALARQGYDVDFSENRDMHNYTGWRDTFDPCLTRLLQRAWA